MSEIGMWPRPTNTTEQASENAGTPTATAEADATETDVSTLEAMLPSAAEQPWDSAAEEEWNEHSATAWALAYVIHRVRSTPHPPILLPEQRRHFEQIVERAAALIAEWQGHERDLAQQLGTRRPVTEASLEALETSQDDLTEHAAADGWSRPVFTPSYHLPMEEECEEAPEEPAADAATQDYMI